MAMSLSWWPMFKCNIQVLIITAALHSSDPKQLVTSNALLKSWQGFCHAGQQECCGVAAFASNCVPDFDALHTCATTHPVSLWLPCGVLGFARPITATVFESMGHHLV
jgi:hypothetical protein